MSFSLNLVRKLQKNSFLIDPHDLVRVIRINQSESGLIQRDSNGRKSLFRFDGELIKMSR